MTDIVGSTALAAQLGDERWREVLRNTTTTHTRVSKPRAARSSSVSATGSFSHSRPGVPLDALNQPRRGLAETKHQPPLAIRAGLHAGEPIADDEDLFGLGIPGEITVCTAKPSTLQP